MGGAGGAGGAGEARRSKEEQEEQEQQGAAGGVGGARRSRDGQVGGGGAGIGRAALKRGGSWCTDGGPAGGLDCVFVSGSTRRISVRRPTTATLSSASGSANRWSRRAGTPPPLCPAKADSLAAAALWRALSKLLRHLTRSSSGRLRLQCPLLCTRFHPLAAPTVVHQLSSSRCPHCITTDAALTALSRTSWSRPSCLRSKPAGWPPTVCTAGQLLPQSFLPTKCRAPLLKLPMRFGRLPAEWGTYLLDDGTGPDANWLVEHLDGHDVTTQTTPHPYNPEHHVAGLAAAAAALDLCWPLCWPLCGWAGADGEEVRVGAAARGRGERGACWSRRTVLGGARWQARWQARGGQRAGGGGGGGGGWKLSGSGETCWALGTSVGLTLFECT